MKITLSIKEAESVLSSHQFLVVDNERNYFEQFEVTVVPDKIATTERSQNIPRLLEKFFACVDLNKKLHAILLLREAIPTLRLAEAKWAVENRDEATRYCNFHGSLEGFNPTK